MEIGVQGNAQKASPARTSALSWGIYHYDSDIRGICESEKRWSSWSQNDMERYVKDGGFCLSLGGIYMTRRFGLGLRLDLFAGEGSPLLRNGSLFFFKKNLWV